MSKEKVVSDNFLTICDRVKNELGIKKDKQLLEFIKTTQPTFSRRKIENNFSIEWAYLISIKTELAMKWILTGRGPKKISENYGDVFFQEIQEWAKEISGSDNIDWLKRQIETTFPVFKKWREEKEEKEESDAKEAYSSSRKVA